MWCAIVWCVVCGPRVYHKGKRPGMSRQAEPGAAHLGLERVKETKLTQAAGTSKNSDCNI